MSSRAVVANTWPAGQKFLTMDRQQQSQVLDIQQQLAEFAEGALREKLQHFAEVIQENVRDDLRQFSTYMSEASTKTTRHDGASNCDVRVAGHAETPGQDGQIPANLEWARSTAAPLFNFLGEQVREPSTPVFSKAGSRSGDITPAPKKKKSSKKSLKSENYFRMTPNMLRRQDSTGSKRSTVTGTPLEFYTRITQRGRAATTFHPIVAGPWFDTFVSFVISVNSVYIGFATNYLASRTESKSPVSFDVVELIFLFIFITEISLRFCVYRLDLFRLTVLGVPNYDIGWNIFDYTVIGFQVLEFLFRILKINLTFMGSISMLRILRLLRLLRIIRLLKVLRFVSDLRMIVMSIYRSLSLFLWSVIALFLLIYIFAIYFVQAVLDRRVEMRKAAGGYNIAHDGELDKYYGTIYRGMVTLFQAVFGGVDWETPFNVLGHIGSWALGPLVFLIYIAFATVAILNVISGVFLDRATERAKQERENLLVASAKEVFMEADQDQTGVITLEDFKGALDHGDVQSFFSGIDLEASEAEVLFNLLDSTQDSRITADEFLKGCLRLRGPAKALDLLKLSHQVLIRFNEQDANIEHGLGRNRDAIIDNRRAISAAKGSRVSKARSTAVERPSTVETSHSPRLPGEVLRDRERAALPEGPNLVENTGCA